MTRATSAPGLGSPLPHLHRTALTPATSAPGLRPPLPHPHRDWAQPCHIHRGTGLAPGTSAPGLCSSRPHLRRDWAHPCHVCPGTRICTGTGSNPLRISEREGHAVVCCTLYVQPTRCMCNRLGARRSSCATLYVCGPPKPMGSFGRGVLQRNGCHEVTDGRCGAGPTGPPVQEWDVDGARRPMLVPADGCAACGRSDLQKRTPWRSHTRAHTC